MSAGARTFEAAHANGNGRPAIVHRQHGAPETVYDYFDADGFELVGVVCRFPGKKFAQARPVDGGWSWSLNGVTLPLYRLSEIHQHVVENRREPVYLVEGEKDVHAVEAAGATATTSPGGAGKFRAEHAQQLLGVRILRVVVDRDPDDKRRADTGLTPGEQHAKAIVDLLGEKGFAGEIELLQAADGKDAADHLAAGGTLDQLKPFTFPPGRDEKGPEPSYEITVYTTRDLASLDLPNPADPIVGPFLRRGMVTLIGGLTGHGKTAWIAQLVKAAADGGDFLGETATGGARVLVLDLEQHLHTAQRVIREAGLDDTDLVDYAPIPEGLALDKRTDQLDAVERLLARGYDVVVLDPFYKLHEADSSAELEARLLVALLKRWIKEHGFALLTATHCRKLPNGRTVITLDDFFGSSLFTRDPELVLGIQRHGDLAKLHVFKAREPGLDYGQVIELLYTRGRGFWPKPTADPEERAKRLAEVGAIATAWIAEHPGESTNKVKIAVSGIAKCGSDLVEEALTLQVKSGLLPEPLKGSRNARLWYPHNHAALTSPDPLWGEVTESAPPGQSEDDFTRPSDFYVVEEGRVGEVDEAQLQRLPERHADIADTPETPFTQARSSRARTDGLSDVNDEFEDIASATGASAGRIVGELELTSELEVPEASLVALDPDADFGEVLK